MIACNIANVLTFAVRLPFLVGVIQLIERLVWAGMYDAQ
jgi:hypothetical protein